MEKIDAIEVKIKEVESVYNSFLGKHFKAYRASEVDALLADVRALVETSRPVLSEFLRWIKNEGGCDHSAGICNCRVINQIAEFDQALAAVEARMKV